MAEAVSLDAYFVDKRAEPLPECQASCFLSFDRGVSAAVSLAPMEIRFKPDTEMRLAELASRSGLATEDLVEDALAGYLSEVTELREQLDGRYIDIVSGRVRTIDGKDFFDSLRQREEELIKQRPPR